MHKIFPLCDEHELIVGTFKWCVAANTPPPAPNKYLKQFFHFATMQTNAYEKIPLEHWSKCCCQQRSITKYRFLIILLGAKLNI